MFGIERSRVLLRLVAIQTGLFAYGILGSESPREWGLLHSLRGWSYVRQEREEEAWWEVSR